MQSTKTTLAGLELATQLISHHASIFLGVIILGMNKPRPWKCPWTSSKKQKKRTKNENTAMNDQAKVGGKLKLRLSGIKTTKDRVDKGAVMIVHVTFFLAGLPLLIQSDVLFSNIPVSVESAINKRKKFLPFPLHFA